MENNNTELYKILKKFKNGHELYKHNILFNYIINAILRNEIDLYKAIELLIEAIGKQSKIIASYAQNSGLSSGISRETEELQTDFIKELLKHKHQN